MYIRRSEDVLDVFWTSPCVYGEVWLKRHNDRRKASIEKVIGTKNSCMHNTEEYLSLLCDAVYTTGILSPFEDFKVSTKVQKNRVKIQF